MRIVNGQLQGESGPVALKVRCWKALAGSRLDGTSLAAPCSASALQALLIMWTLVFSACTLLKIQHSHVSPFQAHTVAGHQLVWFQQWIHHVGRLVGGARPVQGLCYMRAPPEAARLQCGQIAVQFPGSAPAPC